MSYAAQPETLLTPEYGCRGSQRVKMTKLISCVYRVKLFPKTGKTMIS